MSLFAELKRRNVIRVVVAYLAGAWLLIQILETLFPIFGLAETSIRVVVVILGIGLVPVAILSWAFELTPEGLKRDAEVLPGEVAAGRAGKGLDRIIMVVLVLGLVYFAVDKFLLDPARDAALQQAAEERGRTSAIVESYGEKSIAVLPFADMSAAEDQAYFSDGIAEEILNLLAQVRELRVISRSSAFQYRGDVHLPTVAEELNVSYVLEGSVRKAGERIRVTAQLIDARADAHVWSETYDRDFEDVFSIQDEISEAIVEQLKVRLLDAMPKATPTDAETYTLYLQGRHRLLVEQHYDQKVEALFRQVLERDPDYVPALNLLVRVTYAMTGVGPNAVYTPEEGIALMRGYVDRALAIDPQNSHATAHRGWMAFLYNRDLETAAFYLNRALSYNPADTETLFYAGAVNNMIGHFEDAIGLLETALARDPVCHPCLYVLMRSSLAAGRLDEALAVSDRRLRTASGGWITRGHIFLLQGNPQKALECYDQQKLPKDGWLGARALALHTMGAFEERDAALAQLEAMDDRDALMELARVNAWSGNADAAFDWLERYLDVDSPLLTQEFAKVLWDPFFAGLRDDPRWHTWRERAGLSEERLAAIEIPLP